MTFFHMAKVEKMLDISISSETDKWNIQTHKGPLQVSETIPCMLITVDTACIKLYAHLYVLVIVRT